MGRNKEVEPAHMEDTPRGRRQEWEASLGQCLLWTSLHGRQDW